MKAFTVFTLGLLASSSALALVGKVVRIDPIELKNESGAAKTCVIKADRFYQWDRGGVVELLGDRPGEHSTNCGEENGSLGALNSPMTLTIEVDGVQKLMTVPAHRTIIFSGRRGFQVDIKDNRQGDIQIDDTNTTLHRDQIQTAHQTQLKNTESLAAVLKQLIDTKQYSQARVAFSALVKNELYSPAHAQVTALLSKMPEAERPIATHLNDLRSTVMSLNKTFAGFDFDQLTLAELVKLAQTWALQPQKEDGPGDETYLFDLLYRVKTPVAVLEEIALQAFESRFTILQQMAEGRREHTKIEHTLGFQASAAYRYLMGIEGPLSKTISSKLRCRLSKFNSEQREFFSYHLPYEIMAAPAENECKSFDSAR